MTEGTKAALAVAVPAGRKPVVYRVPSRDGRTIGFDYMRAMLERHGLDRGEPITPISEVVSPGVDLWSGDDALFYARPNRAIWATTHTERCGFASQFEYEEPRACQAGELYTVLCGPFLACGFDDMADNAAVGLTLPQVCFHAAYFTAVSPAGSGTLAWHAWQHELPTTCPEREALAAAEALEAELARDPDVESHAALLLAALDVPVLDFPRLDDERADTLVQIKTMDPFPSFGPRTTYAEIYSELAHDPELRLHAAQLIEALKRWGGRERLISMIENVLTDVEVHEHTYEPEPYGQDAQTRVR